MCTHQYTNLKIKLFFALFRSISLLRDPLRVEEGHRLLLNPSVHAKHTYRDSQLGGFLD